MTQVSAPVATLTLCAAFLCGCSTSLDKHEFVSTIDRPVSIALYDSMRKSTLWEYDIPVEHKLVLDFDRPLEFEPFHANMDPATKMKWKLYSLRDQVHRIKPIESHSMDLPGTPFLMKYTVRPAPEFPPQIVPIAAAPVEATGAIQEKEAVEAGPASDDDTQAPADEPAEPAMDEPAMSEEAVEENAEAAAEAQEAAEEVQEEAVEAQDEAEEVQEEAEEAQEAAEEVQEEVGK